MIDLIIDIPSKPNNAYSDGFKIRRTAAESSVTLMTSLDTVKALVEIMKENYNSQNVNIISLDDIK